MNLLRQPQPSLSPVAEAVLSGLSDTPKHLPPWLFYDDAGSALFEQITELPEYYLTRTERSIFEQYADNIIASAGDALTLIELGAGTSAKTRILIEAVLRRQPAASFYPVDVSESALAIAKQTLQSDFPQLAVRPVLGDYTQGIPQLSSLTALPGPKLVLYIGSSIGNFEPEEAAVMLRRIAASCKPGDALLLGADMLKPEPLLLAAYNDAQGVTARFNLNLLARINREFGGDFDLETFRHVAIWNPRQSRIEIYLESAEAHVVNVHKLGASYRFAGGERIHTENSYKFTPKQIRYILGSAGFEMEKTWYDRQRWFSVTLSRLPA